MEDDDVAFKVFAVVTGTTGEDTTFKISVIDTVAVDGGVIFGAVEVLEVRTCSGVSSGICVTSGICASVAVPREPTIYIKRNNKLI